MLYKIITALFYLTTKAYFRSITKHGKKHLPPKNTPVIFVSNHPSAFMDPILLAALINSVWSETDEFYKMNYF